MNSEKNPPNREIARRIGAQTQGRNRDFASPRNADRQSTRRDKSLRNEHSEISHRQYHRQHNSGEHRGQHDKLDRNDHHGERSNSMHDRYDEPLHYDQSKRNTGKYKRYDRPLSPDSGTEIFVGGSGPLPGFPRAMTPPPTISTLTPDQLWISRRQSLVSLELRASDQQ
ncbi:uncharacterized protein B0I36DRAFT_354429 [Microdochium trichocladiopsis]|uniref:Uncharacterized protein n=1 Tax=Microdochium trichocladiopsis TaxID=1682393 RepID=A0A9P8XX55_9PEZI|nr:uncharacterized protein B0I36DRAFT_354429 [Microdochium trichocladiopsis]KAH7018117.1 hypothetical protein B0I36DRAFT_354429 [Microdochium trichocladiopsis]